MCKEGRASKNKAVKKIFISVHYTGYSRLLYASLPVTNMENFRMQEAIRGKRKGKIPSNEEIQTVQALRRGRAETEMQ